jgi:hypothetical protein
VSWLNTSGDTEDMATLADTAVDTAIMVVIEAVDMADITVDSVIFKVINK